MPSMLDGQRSPIGSLAKLGDGVRANSDAKTQAGLGRGAGQSKKLVNVAWTQTFPAQGATLDLDFANDRGFVRGVGQGRSMDAVTFTRASNGTFVKPDGTLSQHSNQGALGKNLLTFPQDFDNAAWTKTNSNVIANSTIAPNGTLTADYLIDDAVSTSHFTWQAITITGNVVASVFLKANTLNFASLQVIASSGRYNVTIDLSDGTFGSSDTGGTSPTGTSYSITPFGNDWYRLQITIDNTSGTVTLLVSTSNSSAPSSYNLGRPSYVGSGNGVFIWGAQLELGSTATEYFPTNINTPRFDWASTASTGAGTIASPYVIPLIANSTSNGLLIEESRTNRILWCRDATQSNWTKTNVTVAKTQTGIDGVANSASSLTASSANGTCIQTITLSSGSRTGSVFLKRITGTGNIQVTLDGTTYSTVDLSNGLWNRIVISATVLNPVVGIRIVTSGDAVAMDFGQVEDGAFATSPIMTTSAVGGVTRSADVASMAGNNFDGWMSEFGTICGNHLYFYTGDAGETSASSTGAPCGFGTASITNQFNPLVLDNTGGVTRRAASYYRSPTLAITPYSTVDNVYLGNIFLAWAVRIQYSNYGLSANASTELTTTIINIATIKSRFVIGGNNFQTGFNGYIKYLRFFPNPKNANSLQLISGGAT